MAGGAGLHDHRQFRRALQTNVKRLLAYSSIAHAGYVLVALTARSEIGTRPPCSTWRATPS
jgi:NADH:ubiquinone oxidoreductase subunit 2 (subunit N)